jgi:hypothetical protein
MLNNAIPVREWRVAYPTSGGFIKFFKKAIKLLWVSFHLPTQTNHQSKISFTFG